MPVIAPSRGFVTLYTVAIAGMFVSFMPFIMVLLPLKVAAVPGRDPVELLSAAALIGALAASGSNIVFGVLSDRTYRLRGTRRSWIWAGLAALALAYAGFALASGARSLLLAVIGLQVAINLGFSPILAMMADEVPDAQKGLVAGLMGTGQPIGSLAAVFIVAVPGLGEGGRYALLCAIIVAMVAPLLLLMRERREPAAAAVAAPVPLRRVDFLRAWGSRMIVQVAGSVLGTYGFYYFLSVSRDHGPGGTTMITTVMAVAMLVALAATVVAGRVSDRVMRRKPFLAGAVLAMAAGLVTMALAHATPLAAAGYIFAQAGMSVFLGVHAALAMQLLPSPDHRGRDLGILNLTNTLPGILAPLLAVRLVSQASGYGLLLVTLALLTVMGGAIILTVATED